MGSYVIFADTGCDIHSETLKKWDVRVLDLTFSFDGEEKSYTAGDIGVRRFYDRMRAGEIARTSALNIDAILGAFRRALDAGKDVFYLTFSSGLSSTYSTACTAAEELAEEYPERKIAVVDSLAASAGYGLLLCLCVRKRDGGADISELKDYAEKVRPHVCHWFTVDDLVYLKRGGRVSAATALAGTVLGIKPVLHVDDAGHLINMSKVRGRKASVKALADKYGELGDPSLDGTVFISDADCREDATALKDILEEKYGVTVELVTDIGPVIGAHSGPGTLALFFLGKKR